MVQRDYQAAEGLLLELLESPATVAEANFLSAVVARRTGRLDEVDAYLRAATKSGWSAADVELQRCLLFAQGGHVEEVERRLREMVSSGVTDQDAEEIYSALTVGFMAEFRMREAWDCLEFWLEWQPSNIDARMMRADICERTGHEDLAIDEYRTILGIHRNHHIASVKLATLLQKTGEVTAANEIWLACLQRSPGDIDALTGLAHTCRRVGNVAESVRFAKQGLVSATVEQRGTLLLELGLSLLAEEDNVEALNVLRQAIESMPFSMDVQHALAQAYRRTGDVELATFHHSEAQRLSSENLRITELTQLLVESPKDPNVRCELAEILHSRGRISEARKWCETALKFQQDHERSQSLMAILNEIEPPLLISGDNSTVRKYTNALSPDAIE